MAFWSVCHAVTQLGCQHLISKCAIYDAPTKRANVQAAGFVDDSGKMRTIPFEVMVQGDKAPVCFPSETSLPLPAPVPMQHCCAACASSLSSCTQLQRL